MNEKDINAKKINYAYHSQTAKAKIKRKSGKQAEEKRHRHSGEQFD